MIAGILWILYSIEEWAEKKLDAEEGEAKEKFNYFDGFFLLGMLLQTGLVTCILSGCLIVRFNSKCMDTIVEYAEDNKSISSLVAQEYWEQYPTLTTADKVWIYVNGQGGLEHSQTKPWTLRNVKQLDYSPPHGNDIV